MTLDSQLRLELVEVVESENYGREIDVEIQRDKSHQMSLDSINNCGLGSSVALSESS